MGPLDHDQIIVFLLCLGTLLGAARLLGEIATRLQQPAVLGELTAGVLLGPTVLGRVAPDAFAYVFPSQGPVASALSGITNLALVLFLLVAGMEVDLSKALRQGRAALALAGTGMLFPFGLGYGAATLYPDLFGKAAGADSFTFALFFGTALCISAMPVVARTLMDLRIYQSDLGSLIMAAAVMNDVVGWIAFAVILSLLGVAGHAVFTTVFWVLVYWIAMLVVGRWLFNRALIWLQAYTSGPGGVFALALSTALFCAAFTEWLGVHAIFGSFMVGVAFGDSPHLRHDIRRTLTHSVSYSLAPLFFATIGLHTDFVANFDLPLIVLVTLVASVGKLVGCGLGGRLGRLAPRDAWAAAASLNARGAMEIILGLLALRFGLIDERFFVALVVMALATSLMSGPLVRRILGLKVSLHATDYMAARSFVRLPPGADRDLCIKELSAAAAREATFTAQDIENAVLERERMQSTALGDELAVPHARLFGLLRPVVTMGVSPRGVDFDAPDGKHCRLVCLLLTPDGDTAPQLALLADIARACKTPEQRDRLVAATSPMEMRALLKTEHEPT